MANWLSSAIQSVRDSSKDAINFVRRDLAEFTTTIKTDTESYLQKVQSQEIGDLGINQFVSKLNSAVKTDDDNAQVQTSPSLVRVYDGLTRMQNDESTYLTDPMPKEAYDAWLQTSSFNVDARKGDIAQLLIEAPRVRVLYARLVPAQTSHVEFWSRYYFRLHQFEEEKVKRAQLLQNMDERYSKDDSENGKNKEDDWDEPDEDIKNETFGEVKETQVTALPAEQKEEKQEITSSEIMTNETISERKQSEPGESWEHEFDATDLNTCPAIIKSDEEPSEEPVKTASPATEETATPKGKSKSADNVDDDWEGWS